MSSVSQQLSRPPGTDLGEDQQLAPLFPDGTAPTLAEWEALRHSLRQQWDAVLGEPSYADFDRSPETIRSFEQPEYRATVLRQPTSPETQQLILLMEPTQVPFSPRPGAVVPFYDPDRMAGYDLEEDCRITESLETQFGRHLIQQGYVVVCTEAFPYNTVPEPQSDEGFAWWRAAAAKVLEDNPNWTGMGKLTWDTRLATDLLLSQPDVDPERILAIGHSLGGKMSFYAGCLDERIKTIIASDFGIGWDFTNWSDPWYLGPQIHSEGFDLAHHQLLALHAPRSFFLVGGEYDHRASWQYLLEAREVYDLYGRREAVGFFDHATGHSPTKESLDLAYRWLAEQFNLPEQPWEL